MFLIDAGGEFTILSTTSFSLQHSSCSSGGPPVCSGEDPPGTEGLSKSSGSSRWELGGKDQRPVEGVS